jgi:hypothetical protein
LKTEKTILKRKKDPFSYLRQIPNLNEEINSIVDVEKFTLTCYLKFIEELSDSVTNEIFYNSIKISGKNLKDKQKISFNKLEKEKNNINIDIIYELLNGSKENFHIDFFQTEYSDKYKILNKDVLSLIDLTADFS